MEQEKKAVEDFYQRCSDLLSTENTYVERNPYWRRTRWSNREPGSGRFPGCGTIRMFSSDCIHVSLTNPVGVNRTFDSAEEVYAFLKKALTQPT
jgi:hypothetical protein